MNAAADAENQVSEERGSNDASGTDEESESEFLRGKPERPATGGRLVTEIARRKCVQLALVQASRDSCVQHLWTDYTQEV